MNELDIVSVVRDFLEDLVSQNTDEPPSELKNLISDGLITSFQLIEIVMFLDETFGITVEHDDLVHEKFDSLKAVTSYIEQALDSQN